MPISKLQTPQSVNLNQKLSNLCSPKYRLIDQNFAEFKSAAIPAIYYTVCQLYQDIEIFHIGHVYSVDFETTDKIFFRSLPGSVLDYEVNGEDLNRSKLIKTSNTSFQGNFGSQNSIPSRKKFSDHSLGQYRTSHINIFNCKPSTGPESGPRYFFSTNLNSTTQSYPKTIYLKTQLIYTCPSPILQTQSPALAYRVA